MPLDDRSDESSTGDGPASPETQKDTPQQTEQDIGSPKTPPKKNPPAIKKTSGGSKFSSSEEFCYSL